ncbi:MAG TPA: thioredoxin [Rhodospirillaceae bacterium]|nr:thioredoxin [Rhodospirillaceae bacterium]
MDFLLGGAKGGKGEAAPAGGGSQWIKDADTATFVQDVLEASMKVPVVVDFWAPWCGPCKTLGPLLERLVTEARGAVHLVKVNVDRNQELAVQMRIQSIPAVYAFKNGRPVDGFVGAVPDSQVKTFVQRLIGDQAGAGPGLDEVLAEAKELLAAGEVEAALQVYQEVLGAEPAQPQAAAGCLRCLLALGALPEARHFLDGLPAELAKNPEVTAARAALELAEQAGQAGPSAELRRALAVNPDDHQVRFDLAMAYYAGGEREAAVEELLELFRRNRAWNDEAARKQLVKLFEAIGLTDPLTVAARKRLSSLMFS